MTSLTRKKRFKRTHRCPECNSIAHLKNKKWLCPNHGIVTPNFRYENSHHSIHHNEWDGKKEHISRYNYR
jgi:transposase